MKIGITTSGFALYSEEPLELLRGREIDYVMNSKGRPLTEDEACKFLRDCVGVVAGTEPLTRRVMGACPYLKVISRCGTGLDNVDLEAAGEKGIAVRNTPDGPTRAVAELALACVLDLLRQVSRMDRELRAGTWKKRMGSLLEGKQVGIVGFGRIGRTVAALFSACGARVAFADPAVAVSPDAAYAKMNPDELCAWAQILSLHCSMPPNGEPVLDAGRLRRLRPGAYLINLARGGLVEEEALCTLLQNGHLGGAALDVFEREPYEGPLSACENVILTPHIGSYAQEARIRMEVETVRNLLEALG